MISPLSQIKRYAEAGPVEAPIATDEIPTEVVPSIADKAQGDLNQGQILLNAQIERLKSSLDKRMNPPFDPMWMKMAAGFLKPSQTGSFGESLGNAAEGAASQAEKDIARHSDIEKMKLELAQKQYELSNQAEAEKMFKEHIGRKTTVGAPTVDKALTSQSLGTTSVPAEQAANAVLQNPNVMDQITWDPESVALIALKNPALGKVAGDILKAQQEKVKLLLEQQKIEQGKYTSTPSGVFEPSSGQFKEKNPQVVERTLPIIGPAKITFEQSQAFDKLVADSRLTGDTTKVKQFLSELQGSLPSKTTTETTLKTPQEKELQSEELKGEYAGTSPAGKAIGALSDSAQTATDVKNLTNEVIGLSKSNPNAFKLLMNKDVRTWYDASLAAVKEGVGTPWGSFNLPSDIVAKYNLPIEDIMALQKFAQIEALSTMMNRRTWLKGEGSVSNSEGASAALLGPQASDRPEVIRMKAESIARKSQFDSDTFNTYSNWKDSNPMGTWRRFLTSDDFNSIKTGYVKDITEMNKANASFLSGKPYQKTPLNEPNTKKPTGGTLYNQIKYAGYGK